MTNQQDIYDLINTAIRLSELASLAHNNAQYSEGYVIVEERNSANTVENANEIIKEHRILSPLSGSINHLTQELCNGLMDLDEKLTSNK